MKLKFKNLSDDLQKVRDTAPLVHNITNYVVMNNTANALLSIGASPVMAHAAEEVAEMVTLASALVINIGTLSKEWISGMAIAMAAAHEKGIPIIFDPVGAGATEFRTRTCLSLLERAAPAVIRGNASEVMALAGDCVQTKGVDSSAAASDAESAALALAKKYDCVVCVSGAIDLITDGRQTMRVRNGHALMPKVTGLGCTATALIGAFCAVNKDILVATSHAMMVMGICGELAAAQATGPGSFQVHLIDAFYNLNAEQVEAHWLDPEAK
ncbi:hydroxyethylthiazole kinase [Malonomonas rubra DSM 5091]|uniref:Hydroxyethylthiazole kinase n=1 Tax=Malonomonas rubra DSM 5091 TaxID=1122189 RepID=A0A1M6IV18_MALRU|nr:hydroxyethylthiazole kinase [Malonomonas rubra]SHJ38305.1 hydroxyethylthiazole kinase [Malonomonas rubra DSM 5091]